MPNKEEGIFETIKVVKRNGSKVGFNGTKIAMAIKKGFDSIKILNDDEEETLKYSSNDIQKVYGHVIKIKLVLKLKIFKILLKKH